LPRGVNPGGEISIPPIFCVFIAAVLWSTGGLFIKWTTLSAYALSFGRSLLAAATIALFTWRQGFGFNRVTALTTALYAALLLLFVIATKQTTAANAIFLQYTAPVYVLVLEPLFYKEKYRAHDLIVVACCAAGMALFFMGRLRPEDVSGNIAALGSGICFAFFILLMRHPRAGEVNRASPIIHGNLLLALLTAPAFFSSVDALSLHDVLILLYLGVVQIGLAYTFFTYGMAHGVRSLDAGIIGYTEPVLNPLWVFIFLGERPAGWALAGGAIIISAVLAHTLWETKVRRPQAV
jgi:drug/metabolite transporter (DMT)-like permease